MAQLQLEQGAVVGGAGESLIAQTGNVTVNVSGDPGSAREIRLVAKPYGPAADEISALALGVISTGTSVVLATDAFGPYTLELWRDSGAGLVKEDTVFYVAEDPIGQAQVPTQATRALCDFPGASGNGWEWLHRRNAQAVRTWLEDGEYFGFTPTAAKPSRLDAGRPGIRVRDSDNHPMWWDGSSEMDMLGAVGGSVTWVNDVTEITRGKFHVDGTLLVLTDDGAGPDQVTLTAPGYTPVARTLTAGAGLTGGGDLTANRQFAVAMPLTLFVDDASQEAFPLTLRHTRSDGAGSAGLAVGVQFETETSVEGSVDVIGGIRAVTTDVTDGDSQAYLALGGGNGDSAVYSTRVYPRGLALSADETTYEDPLDWDAALTIATTSTGATTGIVLRNADDTVAESDSRRSPGVKFSWKAKLYQEVGSGVLVDREITIFGESADEGSTDLDLAPALKIADTGAVVFDARGGGLNPGQGRATVYWQDDTTNSAPDLLRLRRTVGTGTAAAGIGASILAQAEDDAGNVQDAGRLSWVLSSTASGSEKGYATLSALNGSGALASGIGVWGSQRVKVGAADGTEPVSALHVVTASTPGLGFYAATINKAQAAGNDNKIVDLQVNGTSVGEIESDSGNQLNLNAVAGTMRLQNVGTSYLTLTASVGLSCGAVLDLQARRLKQSKGSDVASASTIALGSSSITGNSGNTFGVTGTTTINTIDATGWTAGSWMVLLPSGSHTYSNSAGNIRCGAGDLAAAAGDVLFVVYDGTNFQLRKLPAT